MLTLSDLCQVLRNGTKCCPVGGKEQRGVMGGQAPGKAVQGSSHSRLLLSPGFMWPELREGEEAIFLIISPGA